MKKISRRTVLKAGAITGGAAAIGVPQLLVRSTPAAAATIAPSSIPKYATPLFVLPAMPTTSANKWSIAARPVRQQILPAGYPSTPVFAMGSTTNGKTFHAPCYTVESKVDQLAQITFSNQLMDSSGRYVPSMLPVDQTLHWANPPGGVSGRDSQPTFTSTPGPYTGPMPFVVHMHGSHDFEENDGYPEAWTLPAAKNIPNGYATVGSFYDQFKQEAHDNYGVTWKPGSFIYSYENDQRATALWFHDHSLGVTRLNVPSGLAGMNILRGGSSDLPSGVLPGPAPKPGDSPGTNYYEMPLIFSDHDFNADGSIFWPTQDAQAGPYIPQTDIPPIWTNPGVLGGVSLVNGNSWPFLNVEPRRYRFRLLNTSNFRVMLLKIVSDPTAAVPAQPALPIWVIGSDGGFLPAPVKLDSPTPQLQIIQSERYDIIVDFTGVPVGTKLYLTNESPPAQTDDGTLPNEVMQFRVVPLKSTDTSTPPDQLSLPGFTPVGPETNTRQVSFNMIMSTFAPTEVAKFLCGTVNSNGTGNPLEWFDPITEDPKVNTTEIWEIWNFAAGGHDFHVHLVEFNVLDRRPIAGGATTPPAVYEVGDKDSVFAPGGQITRIKATFDHVSRFVWHCHFLDHEDNGMMRPWHCVP
ncbi:MAG TPA: multicopper oxidase domain-containing protein [Streptosporangiaceae bacterium]|jgi:bilirubin oxidase